MHEFCSIFIRNTVKQGQSLTHMVSLTKFNMLGQRVSVCRANVEGKKKFSRKALDLWFLSLFQNLIRRTLCLCWNKQCLVLWERTRTRFTAGNSPYLEQRVCVQAGWSAMHTIHHTVAYLHFNVPEFIEPGSWPPNSPDLNPMDYSLWTAL